MIDGSCLAPWWKEAVVYQIYPRSFQDSNGDGVGDLNGIRSRLGHLQALGVDTLWLSPIHPSPQKDFGYDISDYRGVDPIFGTLGDMDALIAEARALGLRVILDLVVNHSSDQHPWFQESRKGPDNPYRDYYLWRPRGPRGEAPNNWASVFGGSAWQDDPSGEAYLHLFLPEQPDLNWRNPAVEREIHDVMRFWLDRGVAGFRQDVYNCYLKHPTLADNPRTWNPAGLLYPYIGQRHVHDQDQPELRELLGRMRAVVEPYDGALVGETLATSEYSAAGRFSGEDALHMTFHFGLLRARWSAAKVLAGIEAQLSALSAEAWPTWVLSNHDFPRAASRVQGRVGARRTDAQLAVAATLVTTLRGTPYLYYGEEIGLRDGVIPRAKLQDPVGKRFWPFYRGRDGCRTPMPWRPEGGFSEGAPWLPLNPDTPERNVQVQEADSGSLLQVWRRLLALRRQSPALRGGTMTLLPRQGELLSWRREAAGEAMLVLLNLGAAALGVELPPGPWEVAFSNARPEGSRLEGARVLVGGDEALVLRRRAASGR